jgi:single-strand DNA-binding protein
MSLKKAFLIGNLGRDPEVRVSASGVTVAKFSLATTEQVRGERETTWHKIAAFGKVADFCGGYLTKGSKVFVEGRISYNQWEDKEGNKRTTTEIIAYSVQGLGNFSAAKPEKPSYEPPTGDTPAGTVGGGEEDLIPF